jgi:dUTP pyrophosphatase
MSNTERGTLKFVMTHPAAVLPVRKHDDPLTGDAGYDMTAVETTTIPARSAAVVPVGLTLADVPPGIFIRIESRSGLQFKHNIHAFGGIIDTNYRGCMGCRLINNSDVDYVVQPGDRIAQLVCYPLVTPATAWSDEATSTDRGANGFGSTGK